MKKQIVVIIICGLINKNTFHLKKVVAIVDIKILTRDVLKNSQSNSVEENYTVV